MRLHPVYSSNEQGGLGDSRTPFCLVTHAITDTAHSHWLPACQPSALSGPRSSSRDCYSRRKQIPCVWERRRPNRKGEQIPLRSLSEEQGCLASRGGEIPPQPGSCLGSRSAAHYYRVTAAAPHRLVQLCLSPCDLGESPFLSLSLSFS